MMGEDGFETSGMWWRAGGQAHIGPLRRREVRRGAGGGGDGLSRRRMVRGAPLRDYEWRAGAPVGAPKGFRGNEWCAGALVGRRWTFATSWVRWGAARRN